MYVCVCVMVCGPTLGPFAVPGLHCFRKRSYPGTLLLHARTHARTRGEGGGGGGAKGWAAAGGWVPGK
jgi:hypothetical protein